MVEIKHQGATNPTAGINNAEFRRLVLLREELSALQGVLAWLSPGVFKTELNNVSSVPCEFRSQAVRRPSRDETICGNKVQNLKRCAAWTRVA